MDSFPFTFLSGDLMDSFPFIFLWRPDRIISIRFSASRGLVKNVIHFARGEWDALAPRGGDEPQEPVGARAEASSQLLRGGDASENVPQESV